MNKKLYISLLLCFCASFMLGSMEKIKNPSDEGMLLTPPYTIKSSASDISSCDSIDNFSPATTNTSAAVGVLQEPYGFTMQAAPSDRRTLAQALAEQHEAEDTKRAAPRLAFAKKVKASRRAAHKAARKARDIEAALAAEQGDLSGCFVS